MKGRGRGKEMGCRRRVKGKEKGEAMKGKVKEGRGRG